MPVTFPVAGHPANTYKGTSRNSGQGLSSSPDKILGSLPTTHIPEKILQSSVDGTQQVVVLKNGLVLGALEAYNKHHHLVIRPDDVWIAILSQLNFYINAHADELRDKLVSHADKKDLMVKTPAPLEKADFGDMAVHMSGQIYENVKDQSLVPWVLPNFSTTTGNDTVICSVLIMSSLKEYFRYIVMFGCGIPSITLEGTQSDWKSILDRIDKIPEFGKEPKEWAGMLRVILQRFVRAFDEGGPPKSDKGFWERIVDRVAGSGENYISGWMTAFCAWDNKGAFFERRKAQQRWNKGKMGEEVLKYDGVSFPRVYSPPEGYAEVDVQAVNMATGEKLDCTMLAGHIGMAVEGMHRDTIRIAPHWFMYVKGEQRKQQGGFWTLF